MVRRYKEIKDRPFKRTTKWMSKAAARRAGNQFVLKQGSLAQFQVKQKGRQWAVFARSRK